MMMNRFGVLLSARSENRRAKSENRRANGLGNRLASMVAAVLTVVASVALIVADPLAAGAQVTGGFDFTRAQVATTGLQVPWGMAFLPDGSALVSERDTARVAAGAARAGARAGRRRCRASSPSGEGGLLGIAVSPTYATDQWVYAYFTASTDNRIVQLPAQRAGQTQQVILTGIAEASIHNGGRIAFGPDGMLYAATGDARQPGQRAEPEQPGRQDPADDARRRGAARATRSPARGSTATATATSRAWPGTARAGCAPPSSARTPGTRST